MPCEAETAQLYIQTVFEILTTRTCANVKQEVNKQTIVTVILLKKNCVFTQKLSHNCLDNDYSRWQ